MMAWIERETVTYKLEELPFDGDGKLAIPDPSIVRVVVPGYKYPVDFGSWCYTKRRRLYQGCPRGKAAHIEVDTNSFRSARVSFISCYLEYLYVHVKLGKSKLTLKTYISQFLVFLVWCDENSPSVLDGQTKFVFATNQYTEYLIQQIRMSLLNINSAAFLQSVVFTVGRAVFNDFYSDLYLSIRKIKKSTAANRVTEKPDDNLARRTLRVYQDLFEQLSDFVLEQQMFPKKILLEHGEFWFFPNSVPFAGVVNIHKKETLKNKFAAYNYVTGEIRSAEEILEIMNCRNSSTVNKAENTRRKALSYIEVANGDRFHHKRIMAATLAFQAFVMMFSANTGMGLGLISAINWHDGQYELDKNKQGFRTVKYRANGKPVTFMITSAFVSAFKKFIILRQYLLEGLDCDGFEKLFFGVALNGKPRDLTMNFSNIFHNRLKICFDCDAKVTTRMWRAYKSDWLIRNSDVSTTSMVLQNTPMTVMKYYAQGSQVQAEDELSTFFEQYKQRLIIPDGEKSISISVGQCSDSKYPEAICKSTVIPDCTKPEGCLFCEKYRVHTDEADVRKLLSCKYVIEKARTVAHDEDHFQRLFTSVLNQINWIIEQVEDSKLLPQSVVNHVKKEVYELEKLDHYWSRKLALLEDLGVV